MLSEATRERIGRRLEFVYGADVAPALLERVAALAERFPRTTRNERSSPWSERDAVLITYGDQVHESGSAPLRTLDRFLDESELRERLSAIHILPFFPYSSDDGFSVMDYRQVDPALGDWDDVDGLGERYELAFDLVLNHCSARGVWFGEYLNETPPYDGFFFEGDPEADLSAVTRPRSSPLLTPFETSRGTRHVWTTFSADQVDLDFSNPDVLVEMLDVLLGYVHHGARIVRLDAIAYLWKEPGTSCIHLPQTHEVVRLMRDVLDDLAPGTLLLSETNVPHAENVSYFGDGDEAHMVYNFSLAPLLLDAFLHRDASPLASWLAGLEPTDPGMSFFNFTASHDGIGVRPLEGLVSPARLDSLVAKVRERGGRVNMRRKPDGTDAPYELNIAYFSALGEPEGLPADEHAARFLASQAVMLALRGVPGIYVHSLLGTPNFEAGVAETGHNRTINRRKFELSELHSALADESSPQHHVLRGYQHLLDVRRECAAFHPDGEQTFVKTGSPELLAFTRTSTDGRERVLVLLHVGEQPATVNLSDLGVGSTTRDLLGNAEAIDETTVRLPPFRTAWLAPGP